MKSKLVVIVLTALATTCAWVVIIAAFLWLPPHVASESDRIHGEFMADKGAISVFDSFNTKTQSVVVVVEELTTGAAVPTGRVELIRRELAPRQHMRIGVRETEAGR